MGQSGTFGSCDAVVASVVASSPQPSFQARLQCGTGVPLNQNYTVGGNFLGGIGYSPMSNANLAVVFSDAPPTGAAFDRHNEDFYTTSLPNLPAFRHFQTAQSQYAGTNEPGINAPALFLASLDGTLAVVVGVNYQTNAVPGTTPPFVYNVYDLTTGAQIGGPETFKCPSIPGSNVPTCNTSVSASVSQTGSSSQSVTVTVPGIFAKSFPIP